MMECFLRALAFVGTVHLAGCSASAGPYAPTSSSTSVPATIQRFGADLDGNGIPDRLDEFIAKNNFPPATKAALELNFRVKTELADKALRGEPLTDAERHLAFDVTSCVILTSKDDGVKGMPSFDDEFMRDRDSFKGMRALMSALNGTLAKMSTTEETCAEARLE